MLPRSSSPATTSGVRTPWASLQRSGGAANNAYLPPPRRSGAAKRPAPSAFLLLCAGRDRGPRADTAHPLQWRLKIFRLYSMHVVNFKSLLAMLEAKFDVVP